MINKLINYYRKYNCIDIVISRDLEDELKDIMIIPDLKIDIIDDVRSATFFAYGKAKLLFKPVILIIDNDNLTNCLTGLTEAWFQQVPVIVISLFNNQKDIYYDFLNNCIEREMNLYELDDEDEYKIIVESSLKAIRPILINLISKYKLSGEYIYYGSILNKLNNYLTKENDVLCYNNKEDKISYGYNILSIKDKYKYGIFSKYMGYSLGKKELVLLLTTIDTIFLDTNIFNNRYINEKFKVILINNKNIKLKQLKSWINNNNIDFIEFYMANIESDNKYIKNFINNNKASILILS